MDDNKFEGVNKTNNQSVNSVENAPVPTVAENLSRSEKKAIAREKTRAEKKEYKERRKIKRGKKSLRCRRLKNFIWFMTGFVVSLVLLFTGIFVGAKLIPLKTFLGDKTSEYVNEDIGNKSLVDAILGYSEYTMEDIPVLQDLLISALSSSGIDGIITLDEDKLKHVKFDSTFADGLLESVKISKELFGDLKNLDVFKNVEVDDPDVTASDFEPKLYYYYDYETEGSSILVLKRAYTDDGTKIAPEGNQIYLRALDELSVGEMQDLFAKRFQLLTVVSVLKTVGGISETSLISEIIGDRTIKDMDTFSEDDILLSVVIDPEDASNEQLYQMLTDITGKASDEITVGDLSGIDVEDVKLTTVLPKTSANEKLYAILVEATGISEDNLTINSLSTFSIDNIKLTTVLPKTSSNAKLYAILAEATGVAEANLKVSDLSSFSVDNVKLTTVLPQQPSNAKLYNILVDAIPGASTANDIILSDLNAFSLSNIKLSTVLDTPTGNKVIDKLRADSTVTLSNIGTKANALTIADILDVKAMDEVSPTAITANFVNTDAIYTYNAGTDTYELVSGTFDTSTKNYTYTGLDTTKSYYIINKTAGVWFLAITTTTKSSNNSADYAGTAEWGAYYTVKDTGGCTLGELENLNVDITVIKIKVLQDLGLLNSGMNPSGTSYNLTVEDLMTFAP